ncbi:MAG: hypothetical protein J6X88_08925 [Bacteroidales bacterium]|nr:hypothetical protein [Bacteroidales bacterium]
MRENFISQDLEDDAGAKVNAIDANKTLIIDQYTSDATEEPDFFQDAKTMKDVFEHFHPSVDVDFENESGELVTETLHFNEMKDFDVNGGKGNLVSNSPFLSDIKIHADNAAKIRKQIEQNAKLRTILKDAQGREELKALLKEMLDELEKVDK